jgi:hypothetical protein
MKEHIPNGIHIVLSIHMGVVDQHKRSAEGVSISVTVEVVDNFILSDSHRNTSLS